MYQDYFTFKQNIKFTKKDSLADCVKLLISSKESLDTTSELLKYLQWDYELLICGEQYMINSQSENPEGLVNKYEYSNGTKYPDIDNFESDRLDFYEACYNNTHIPSMKIRYLNYLIDYSNSKYKFVNLICPLIYNICENTTEDIVFYTSMCRLINLSLKFHISDFINKANLLLHEKLLSTNSFENIPLFIHQYYYLYRKLCFTKREILISDDEILLIINNLKNIINYFKSIGRYEQSIICCDELIEWFKSSKQNNNCELILKYKVQVYSEEADVYIDYSKYHEAAFYLEKAISICTNYGFKNSLDELKVKLKNCYKNGLNNLNEEKIPLTIPKEIQQNLINEINQFITGHPYKDFDSLIAFLLSNIIDNKNNIFPTFESSKLSATKRCENPIWSLVGISKMQDSRKIADSTSREENIKLLTYEDFGNHLQIFFTIFFSNTMNKLKAQGLTSDMVTYQIYCCKSLEYKDKALLSKGISHLFKDDYISSMHILVPIFENIFRSQFSYYNHPTTTIRSQTTQHEQTFNEFLCSEIVKSNIPEILLDIIKYVMVEDVGFNLRNNIAHGLTDLQSFNETMANIVLFLILSITKFDWLKYNE